jgi:putative ABC transport system permease protein
MNVVAITRVAGRALLRNRLRSLLTALGVVIGVGAVIAMVAIGEGAKRRVEQTFEAMGTNLLIVLPGSSSSMGMRGGFGSQATLTWGDLKAVGSECKAVAAASPVLSTHTVVRVEDQNWTTSIVGASTEYMGIRNWQMARGRFYDQSDIDMSNKVVVLGETVVDNLWGKGFDPVGQTVRILTAPFKVIGVLAKKGQSPMGQDYDDTVLMPYSAYLTRISAGLGGYINGIIMVSATTSTDTVRAQNQITLLLRDRHHLIQGADDDFSVRNLSEIAQAQQQGTTILTTLLASIAAVSLLVGGIGIMNIMLVSVTERTREIGTRMAVGAHGSDILMQFLIEAVTLSSVGGVIGILFGIGASQILSSYAHWPTLISLSSIIIAFMFSGAVGIFFGFYPARKAAALDPIEALRYE